MWSIRRAVVCTLQCPPHSPLSSLATVLLFSSSTSQKRWEQLCFIFTTTVIEWMDLTPKCFPYILLMIMSTSASTSSSLDLRHTRVRLTSVTVFGVFWLNFVKGPSCDNLSQIDNHIVQRRKTGLEYRHVQWITGLSDPWRRDHHDIWKRVVLIIQCDAAPHLRRTDT